MDKDNLMFEDDGIHIVHTRNEDDILKEINDNRKNLKNEKGFSDQKMLRHVCSIPVWYFENNPKLVLYDLYRQNGMVPEAKRMLREFLLENPQFIVSNRNV